MRKYAFRQGDIVREKTDEKKPVIGRVIGFGFSAGHDWYKVASGGDVYNCRDDELVLVRRGHAERVIPPIGEDEIDRFLLIWRPMSVDPPKGEECAVIWRTLRGAIRVSVMRWTGEDWAAEEDDGGKYHVNRGIFSAWALWEWPETDGKEAGDHDADQDDGQGGD